MKLYEFIYTDKQNLSKSELTDRIQAFLRKESEIQGWVPDYTFEQSKVEQISVDEKNYTFEVRGQYLDSEERKEDSDPSPFSPHLLQSLQKM